MNRWQQAKREEIDRMSQFNSESFLSSDSGLYERNSDSVSQAAGEAGGKLEQVAEVLEAQLSGAKAKPST